VAAFVINEWLWSDLSGVNGRENQRQAFEIIVNLPSSGHRIVVIENSPFDRKGWGLCRNDNPMVVQQIGGVYKANVRLNSDLCLILRGEAIATLPDGLAAATKPDDHYLVQAQLSVNGAILVTTDVPLREAVSGAGLACLSREDFLSTYF
jgi:hypothetical protein